ncbi:MAG: hypothetical protein AAFO82_19510, partial [Bacteroidota bacterium]
MRTLLFLLLSLSLTNYSIANDNIDIELKFSTLNNDVPLYTKTPFTLSIVNKGENVASNLQIQFSVQKPTVVFVGEAPIVASKGFYRAHGDQIWEIASLAPQENATLDLQLFFLETPELFAEVVAVDQIDSDSSPNNGKQGEDDEAVFPIISDCSFLEQYVLTPPLSFDVISNLNKEIELTETDDLYQVSGTDFNLSGFPTFNYDLKIDKEGKLQDFLIESLPELTPAMVSYQGENLVQLIKLDNNQDTIFSQLITVDYPDPTAVVINSPVRQVSDGYVFGGFIVDVQGDQMFTGFLVKTDLNGENAKTILIPDIDDTLGIG